MKKIVLIVLAFLSFNVFAIDPCSTKDKAIVIGSVAAGTIVVSAALAGIMIATSSVGSVSGPTVFTYMVSGAAPTAFRHGIRGTYVLATKAISYMTVPVAVGFTALGMSDACQKQIKDNVKKF
jgi:hypothetical protein